MKDSHIGVYGTSAIVLSLLLRWTALVYIVSVGPYWVAFIAVGALSRAGMVALMAALPNARDGGLSRSVGRPPPGTAWLALLIAAGFALLCGYPWLIIIAVITTATCSLVAHSKVGGQTGDILGATQQVNEITLLMGVVVTIT